MDAQSAISQTSPDPGRTKKGDGVAVRVYRSILESNDRPRSGCTQGVANVKIKTLTALLAVVTLTAQGCVSIDRNYERTWQTLHLVDTGQTVNIARAPTCYHEVTSRAAMTEHPSEGRVYAVMGAYALSHYFLNDWLTKKAENDGGAWWGISKAFQATTLSLSAYNVINNRRIGLSPWGSGAGCQGVSNNE
jgi:hypothetical protein